METRTDSIAIDAGALTEVIDELIEACLPDKLTRTTRLRIYAPDDKFFVVEYEADCTYRWSTGEKVIWDLLVSLSGRGSVNLAQLSAHFRGTDEWPLIIKAIGALS
jgi:hypothetical protein